MLFLLVTLLANHGDASCHSHAYHLQSAIKQELGSQAFLAITRYGYPHVHTHIPQPGRGATDANQVPSFLALVQPSPQGTWAGVLVQFWLSGLDTVPRMAPWYLTCPKYQ